MKRVNYLLISVFCLFVSSCANHKIDKNGDIGYYHVDITNDLLSSDIDLTSLFKDYWIIKLDAGKDEYIDNFASFKVLNDKIYVLDRFKSKAVFIFTLDGQYINKIHKVGKGPGEYLHMADFDVDKETGNILILDWNKGAVLSYDISGNYITTLNLNNRYSTFTKYNDRYLMSNHYSSNKEDTLLNIHDNKGSLRHSFFSAFEYQNCSEMILRLGGSFFQFNDECRYFIPETDTVYQITENQISPYLALGLSVQSQNKPNMVMVLIVYWFVMNSNKLSPP
jgi:hypothetical protein